jgi:predicted DNA-binding transcriptional regulator AlpA
MKSIARPWDRNVSDVAAVGPGPESVRTNLEELLSREEIEAEYGLTRRYLEVAAWRGDGPPLVKLGRRTVRYRRADILEFIASKTVQFDK